MNRKLNEVTYYLSDVNNNIEQKESIDELIKDLDDDTIDMAIIPYTMYLDKLLTEDFNIVYNFKDILYYSNDIKEKKGR